MERNKIRAVLMFTALALTVFLTGPATVFASCVGDSGYLFEFGETVTENCTFDGPMARSDPSAFDPTGHGLIIGIPGITIDGNGFCLDGEVKTCDDAMNPQYGIYNWNKHNVTIKDLEIKNFCTGIRLEELNENVIDYCDIHDNGDQNAAGQRDGGIWQEGVAYTTISNCKIHHNEADPATSGPPAGHGIYYCAIENEYDTGNVWTGNEIYENIRCGAFFRCKPIATEVSYNYVHDNGWSGVRAQCVNCQSGTFKYNYVTQNGTLGALHYGEGEASGITIGGHAANPNTACYNVCTDNQGYGMEWVRSAKAGCMYENTLCGNSLYDLRIWPASGGAVIAGACNVYDTELIKNMSSGPGADWSCGAEPNAGFSFAQTGSLQITFTDTSTNGAQGDSVDSWYWDFGDCSAPSTVQDPIYTFPEAGTYTVCLSVNDVNSCLTAPCDNATAYNIPCNDTEGRRDAICQQIDVMEEFAPDYVISDKSEDWVDPADPSKGYKVHYTVTNQGNANATQISDTCLFIEGANVESQSCPALAVGDTYSYTFDGNFTCVGPDDNVTVCADWGDICDGNGVIGEGANEDNNCLSNIWQCYIPGANLVVTHKEENWQDRDTYKVLYTVTNEGDMTAGVSRTCVTVDGVEKGRNLTPALESGVSIQGVFGPFQYTADEDTIIVCADCENDVDEPYMGTGETDNCLENQLIPDLTVTDKYEQWNKDGTYNVYYTKQNIGNAPCGTSITCVYIDSELEQSILNPALQPGESMDGVFESLVCSPDSDNVTVCADCGLDIPELNENNNCLSNTWDCYHRPDLVISGWSLMVDDDNASRYQLYFTVENIGSAYAGNSTTKLMRDGDVFPDPSPYKDIPTPALAAGASVTQKFTDIEKPTKALKICADSTSAVEESKEGNNCTPCGGLNIWGGPGPGPKTYVDVRDGLGVPGSTDRVVQINLNNSDAASDKVKGVEIEVMDAGDWLTIREAKAYGRAEVSGFTCAFSELGNGAVRVELASSGNATIKKGTGPVITLKYRVLHDLSIAGSCIALDPVKVKVADSNGNNIQTLADSGRFCFTSDSWGDVYPEASCGDGFVNIFDILEEIGFALGSDTPSDCQFVAGDVPNGTPPNCVQPNEDINILDVLVVIEKALGINNCAESFNG